MIFDAISVLIMRELKYNTKQVQTQEIIHATVKVHEIVEKIAGVNGPLHLILILY